MPVLPRASVADTARVLTGVVVPLLARGVILRRPVVVRALEALDADARAVRLLVRLRDRYGPGPLRLRIPRRRTVLVLDPAHVQVVLDGSPEPFSPATREKRAALGPFQPHGVLVSTGAARADRRRFVVEVLDTAAPVHRASAAITARVATELAPLDDVDPLTWPSFARAWWRTVRGVVLGAGAVDDEALTDDLARLRAAGNWSVLHRDRPEVRERFLRRLTEHVARAAPGSLAASMAGAPVTADTDPVQQVPQWLFAFDAAGMATFRALALLATHPAERATAQAEVAAAGAVGGDGRELPFLRACLLESIRLLPTTPAVLRETTTRTRRLGAPIPPDTQVVVFAQLFHRDPALPEADRFAPGLWLRGPGEPGSRAGLEWPFIPFSAGPVECPGRNLVLHVGSTALARLVTTDRTLAGRRLTPDAPLPGTLDPFSLRFTAAD